MLTLPQSHPGRSSKPRGGEGGPPPGPGPAACDQDSRWKQYLEDERIALFLQNEEFMKELQRNRDFLLALERGGHPASPPKKTMIWAVASGPGGGYVGGQLAGHFLTYISIAFPGLCRSPRIQPVGVWEHLGTQRERDVTTGAFSSALHWLWLGCQEGMLSFPLTSIHRMEVPCLEP